MNAFAPACGKIGISYTGRSRKAYVVVGRAVVRVKLPTGCVSKSRIVAREAKAAGLEVHVARLLNQPVHSELLRYVAAASGKNGG